MNVVDSSALLSYFVSVGNTNVLATAIEKTGWIFSILGTMFLSVRLDTEMLNKDLQQII